MWHRCTSEFRGTVLRAYEQACFDRAPDTPRAPLSTADLLQAVWRDGAEQMLTVAGVSRQEWEAWPGDQTEAGQAADYLTLTDAARTARDAAYDEAVFLGDNQVGAEHLLLSTLR